MIHNFKNIDYLTNGNNKQKLAFLEIKKFRILDKLQQYNPILTGTIPLDIDLPESDLDIICQCKNHTQFNRDLIKNFSDEKDFKIYSTHQNGIESTIAEFKTDHFLIEIFGQKIPTEKQNAYRHMMVEYQILIEKGIDFKKKIRHLKSTGLKTEPAFAKLLGLQGDPYLALLELEK